VQIPETRYARNGEVNIAYQVIGEGDRDLVFVPGFISHLDLWWTLSETMTFFRELSSFARLILFDKRGTGLSDPVAGLSTLEERMEDLHAVLDAAGSERATVMGVSEGGPMSALFAATYPERVTSLVLYGTFPTTNAEKLTALGATIEGAGEVESRIGRLRQIVDEHWGEGRAIEFFVEEIPVTNALRRGWGLFERAAASPAMVRSLLASYDEIDVTSILPTLQVPTLVIHRAGDTAVPVAAARVIAERIPGASYVELPGKDHIPWIGDSAALIAEIEEFMTGARHVPEPERALATVLFTDIAGSTDRAAELGDSRWRAALEAHHALVREELGAHRGREVKTMGDGFLATFDGPARAIRCACAINRRSEEQGLPVRAGVHTGECELMGDDVGGIAVHIGARVAALAKGGEVLVSSTVRDLVVGSGIEFEDRGAHELKGVPGQWQLAAVASLEARRSTAAPRTDDLAPNAELRRFGDRTMLRVAQRAPGALRVMGAARRRRAEHAS
jgi:pimeloyl-ACP methyl ester carboxylesterase/class 3 adenylate cyclase